MQRRKPESDPASTPETLSAALVQYTDRPDRMTLHPADVDAVTLMGTWLTANAEAFVSLESVR